MKKIIAAVVAAVATITLAGCGAGEYVNAAADCRELAREKDAGFVTDTWPKADADGIAFSSAKEEGQFFILACVLKEFDASTALVAEIDSTSALMGQKEWTEKGHVYRWSYHPDNGVNMTITSES